MTEMLRKRQTQELAFLELSALRVADVLPRSFDRARIARAGTIIYDISGEPLFRRLPLTKSRGKIGYADVAMNPVMAAPMVGVSSGFGWHAAEIREQAAAAASRRRIRFDSMRFVAYSFPKIAMQFLSRGQEVGMLELFSWEPVPELHEESDFRDPGNFDRWSYVAATREEAPRRTQQFEDRMALWQEAIGTRRMQTLDTSRVSAVALERLEMRPQFESRVLHYSTHNDSHEPCFELHGQETHVWCVAASVEMFLEFWRYEYSQIRIANELGLGTLANPKPLYVPSDVPIALEALTSKGMDATMHVNPAWKLFRDEIIANRPVISFVPKHSRTVAGYYEGKFSILGMTPFRGLLVYDPWPPNAGVITQWENFDTHSYLYAFTGRLPLV